MKTSLLLIAIFICSAFTFLQTNNITGNWIGNAKVPDGNLPLNFTFKVDGGNFTGSVQGTRKTYPMVDTKIMGDSIYFAVVVDNGSKLIHAGKYYAAGDSMCFKLTFMGSDMFGTVKRNVVDN